MKILKYFLFFILVLIYCLLSIVVPWVIAILFDFGVKFELLNLILSLLFLNIPLVVFLIFKKAKFLVLIFILFISFLCFLSNELLFDFREYAWMGNDYHIIQSKINYKDINYILAAKVTGFNEKAIFLELYTNKIENKNLIFDIYVDQNHANSYFKEAILDIDKKAIFIYYNNKKREKIDIKNYLK